MKHIDEAIDALLADDDGGPSWCFECVHDKRDAAAAAVRIVAPIIERHTLEAAEQAILDEPRTSVTDTFGVVLAARVVRELAAKIEAP